MTIKQSEAVLNAADQMNVEVKVIVEADNYVRLFIGKHWFLSQLSALSAITNEYIRRQRKWSKPSKKSK